MYSELHILRCQVRPKKQKQKRNSCLESFKKCFLRIHVATSGIPVWGEIWPHGSIHTALPHRNKLVKSAYTQPCSPSTETAWPLFCPTDFVPPLKWPWVAESLIWLLLSVRVWHSALCSEEREGGWRWKLNRRLYTKKPETKEPVEDSGVRWQAREPHEREQIEQVREIGLSENKTPWQTPLTANNSVTLTGLLLSFMALSRSFYL